MQPRTHQQAIQQAILTDRLLNPPSLQLLLQLVTQQHLTGKICCQQPADDYCAAVVQHPLN